MLEPRGAGSGGRAHLARAAPGSASLVGRHRAAARARFVGERRGRLIRRAPGLDHRGDVGGRLLGRRSRPHSLACAVCLCGARRSLGIANVGRSISGGRRRRRNLGYRAYRYPCHARAVGIGVVRRGLLRRRLARAGGSVTRCRCALIYRRRDIFGARWIVCGRLLRTHGQQRERIDVAVWIRRDSDPKVNVRRSAVVGRGRDRSDRFSFTHESVLRNSDRAQSDERDRIAVARADGDRAPVPGNGAGEGDSTGRRRARARAGVGGNIDAAVLTAGIGIVAEGESANHLTVSRPGPARRGSGQNHRGQCSHKREYDRASHLEPPFVVSFVYGSSVARRRRVVNSGYSERP